eukprot:453886-Hanusia_phi.AAC.10
MKDKKHFTVVELIWGSSSLEPGSIHITLRILSPSPQRSCSSLGRLYHTLIQLGNEIHVKRDVIALSPWSVVLRQRQRAQVYSVVGSVLHAMSSKLFHRSDELLITLANAQFSSYPPLVCCTLPLTSPPSSSYLYRQPADKAIAAASLDFFKKIVRVIIVDWQHT